MNSTDLNQPPEPLHPQLVLQKLIRLLRKHTVFDFADPIRNIQFKVENPALVDDSSPNEHFLRNFWRHCQNLYFRRPSQPELARLEYFSNILFSEISNELPFRPNQHFWKKLQGIFKQGYLQKQFEAHDKNIDAQNWLCTLYLYNHLLQNQEGRSYKQIQKQLKKLVAIRQVIEPVSNKNRFQRALQIENKQLKNLIPPIREEQNEVSEQIRQFQAELNDTHNETAILFNELMCRIGHEQQQKKMIYCFGNQEYDIEMNEPQNQELLLYNRIQTTENQLKYLEYEINNLEKKQVAESISKVVSFEKSRGQNRFVVVFEQAMNVKDKHITQRELLEFNALREFSLFKYYTTAIKTPYSFICHNSYGFKQIFLHRNKECKYAEKNVLQHMKKAARDPYSEYHKAFENFQICHHCKLLYPENFLVKCSYSSEKIGESVKLTSFFDSYTSQITKIQSSKFHRSQIRKRNCLENYTKIGDLYFCHRKFCFYCIQNNYQEGLDKDGHCPFCQGICFCTRCTRSDMIVRLKSIYNLLGGDVSRLPDDDYLEFKDQGNDIDTNSTSKKSKSKKTIIESDNLSQSQRDKMNALRVQLQPLRLLGDLVKKRQKKKTRYYQSQQEFFMEKMQFINRNLIGDKNNRGDLVMQEEEQLGRKHKSNYFVKVVDRKSKRMI